jgi:hypothetical protein
MDTVMGSGVVLVREGVAVKVADTESWNPLGCTTLARICVIVPGSLFWVVKVTVVGVLPSALEPT